LAATVDEQNWGSEREQQQKPEEKQPPWFHIGEVRPPQYPQKRKVKEDALAALFSNKTGTSSFATNPWSTPQRTQTWVMGPLP
jgi:hypothetical protein